MLVVGRNAARWLTAGRGASEGWTECFCRTLRRSSGYLHRIPAAHARLRHPGSPLRCVLLTQTAICASLSGRSRRERSRARRSCNHRTGQYSTCCRSSVSLVHLLFVAASVAAVASAERGAWRLAGALCCCVHVFVAGHDPERGRTCHSGPCNPLVWQLLVRGSSSMVDRSTGAAEGARPWMTSAHDAHTCRLVFALQLGHRQ